MSNGLYQSKYTAAHCGLKYEMKVDTVTIRVLKFSKKKLKDEPRAKRVVKSNEKAQKRREKVQNRMLTKSNINGQSIKGKK